MTAREAREMVKKYKEAEAQRNHDEAQKVREEMDAIIAEAASNGSNYTSLAVPVNHNVLDIIKKSFHDDGFEVSHRNDDKIFFVKW